MRSRQTTCSNDRGGPLWLHTWQVVRALCAGWRPDTLALRHVRLLWLVHACWAHDPNQRPPFSKLVALLDGTAAHDAIDDVIADDAPRPHADGTRHFSPFNLIDRITLPPLAPMAAFSPLSANSSRSWDEEEWAPSASLQPTGHVNRRAAACRASLPRSDTDRVPVRRRPPYSRVVP